MCLCRTKKDSSEQKRLDERARRDAIFTNYLQGKTDVDNPVDIEPVSKRSVLTGGTARRVAGQAVKPVRPKSQPSLIVDDEGGRETTTRRFENPGVELYKSEFLYDYPFKLSDLKLYLD